jgi:hypothetical protein
LRVENPEIFEIYVRIGERRNSAAGPVYISREDPKPEDREHGFAAMNLLKRHRTTEHRAALRVF